MVMRVMQSHLTPETRRNQTCGVREQNDHDHPTMQEHGLKESPLLVETGQTISPLVMNHSTKQRLPKPLLLVLLVLVLVLLVPVLMLVLLICAVHHHDDVRDYHHDVCHEHHLVAYHVGHRRVVTYHVRHRRVVVHHAVESHDPFHLDHLERHLVCFENLFHGQSDEVDEVEAVEQEVAK